MEWTSKNRSLQIAKTIIKQFRVFSNISHTQKKLTKTNSETESRLNRKSHHLSSHFGFSVCLWIDIISNFFVGMFFNSCQFDLLFDVHFPFVVRICFVLFASFYFHFSLFLFLSQRCFVFTYIFTSCNQQNLIKNLYVTTPPNPSPFRFESLIYMIHIVGNYVNVKIK